MTKKNTRIKIQLPQIGSRTEAEAIMNELALTEANKRKLCARLDIAKAKLEEEAAPAIGECDAAIKAKSDALRAWAEANPQEFAKGKKSIAFVSGVLGFRTGTPKLVPASRAFNWETITGLVCKYLPNFIRNKPEVDKEAILGQRDELAPVLPRCGLKVTQGETFFIETNETTTDCQAGSGK